MSREPLGRLVCDLGGTNMRIALAHHTAQGTTLLNRWSTSLSAFASFDVALEAYLDEMRPDAALDIAIGAAGPISGNRVKLTNADWILQASKISPLLWGGNVLFFNDLQPVARSIPALDAGDVETLRHGDDASGAARLAVNVGTGFGAAALHKANDQWHAVATEAGHTALPAILARDVPEITSIGDTLEDLMSGQGVMAIYRHLSGGDHPSARATDFSSAADLFDAAADDPIAMRTVDLFGYALGLALRDLILAHAAWGGVYLFGSVIKGWRQTGRTDPLEDGLCAIDAMGPRIARVPIHRITNEDAALLGLALL
jgi:glucokinase